MRRSLLPLIAGFAAGVLCLAVFLTATGRLALNRPSNLPALNRDVTSGTPETSNAASPDLPDPSTFKPLPPLTKGDPVRPPQLTSSAAAPELPDPSAFKPSASSQSPLPPLSRTDPTHAPKPSIPAGAGPAPPDAKVFTPPNTGSLPPAGPDDIQVLESKHLVMPIAGLKPANILDTFNDTRGSGRKHEAADILSPRGTPVLAMEEGNVVKLFTSKLGGLTVYQFDNQRVYCYYYAHLDRYAEGLKEGMLLRKGDKLGYVGTTGDADPRTPHLHLAIFKLGPDKHWWQGAPINPYPVLMHILGR